MINRALTLPAIVTLVLLTVLAALVAGASAVSAQGAVPDAPDRPVGTAVFIGGVDLEWNEVPGADSYGVQMYRNGQWTDLPGDGIEIAFYGAGAIISELEPEGSSYWFRVRARSVHGFSEWSDYNFMASTNESKSGRQARPENVPASGEPVISGTAQVGETLTADTTDVEDGNGLDRVQFRFQWVSHDGSADTDIANATDSTYTLVADDEGKAIKVRVSFTDRGGYAESLTGGETATVAARPNSPATGAPAVTGTAQVGETLAADTSGIGDTDGLTKVSYSYLWIANDGTADTDITGATASTYALMADDAGNTIKVRVSFTDDAGNDESLTSAATEAVDARPNSPATGQPTQVAPQSGSDPDAYVTVVITSSDDTVSWSDPDECTSDYNTYLSVTSGPGTGTTSRTHIGSVASGSTEATQTISLNWTGNSLNPPRVKAELYCGTFDASSSQNVLIASTGLATQLYLAPQFTGLREGTYSSAPLTALTISSGTLSPTFDRGINTYTAEVPSDVEVITLDPTVLTGYQTDFVRNPGWGVVSACGWGCNYSYGNGATTGIVLADADEETEGFQINLNRGENRLGIGVNTGNVYAGPGRLYLLAVTVANSPATGQPTISGTAEMGETLTADTSGIVDIDGLDNVSFSYQWIRSDGAADLNNTAAPFHWNPTDGTADLDIDGATSATYTVTVTDVDKAIKLRVDFTDDKGSIESLTSSATVVVPVVAAFTFSIDGTTVTCDSYNVHIVNLPKKECDDPSSIDQGASEEIEVEIEIARSVNSQLYKFDFHIYQMEDSLGNYRTVEANDLCLGPGLAESASIEITPNDGTGPFTYTDDGTIFELCPAGTFQLYVPWYRYNYTDQEYEYAGTFRRYFFITSDDEVDASIEKVKWITALYPDPPASHDDVQIEATKESEVLNRDLATFSLSIGGLVPDSDAETTDYVVRLKVIGDDGPYKEVPWCHVGNVGYSYLLKTVPEDGRWAMDAHVLGNCLLGSWPDTLQVELFNGAYEFIAGKDIALGALPNSAATGAPTISDTAQVGETLTADTAGIADDDGLDNVSYSYQWLADDADIAGATATTYTLADADEGKAIKVRVSFTDDAGFNETLTSAATEAVSFAVQQQVANSPATGAPTISGTAQVGETLTADITSIADDDGLDNVSYSYQWVANDGNVDTDIMDATDSAYTLVAPDEGKAIKVKVSFTDDAGNGETLTSTATSSVAARTNTAATGAPTISGTAQVGEILSADTSGIGDADGLTNGSYSYQWIRNDGSSDTDITDAADSSYTLVAADEGKTIKVRVSFTDDAANEETLTSTATEAVSFAVQQQIANSPATGAPTISGAAQVGEALTADTSGIADTDGLVNATFRYQWMRNDGTSETDIQNATGSTYTLVDNDEGQTIKVKVSFTDDAGNDETLSSGATDAVTAPECDNIGDCDIEDVDDLLLPDLVSYQHDYSVAEVVATPDGTEFFALRFAGFVTNLGDGPLDLRGNPQLADDADLTSHDVWQRALTIDGDWVNLTKPPIDFEVDDGHDHFHVMGIVEYSLWDTSGTVEISSGAKIGFCLIDVMERPDLHANPGPKRHEQWDPDNYYCQSGRPRAKILHMGISEGWQDIYSFSETFQWIDVSDVQPGYYRIGQRVDPDNVIVESDETNNELVLTQRLQVVPGYVARPEMVSVEPDAAVRFKLSVDEYFDDTNLEDGSPRTRAHRIVTQPSHGSLAVGDTVTVIVDGATHQVFTDEWVTYTPDPGYAGVDSFTFVALDESLPRYPINPVVATVTLDITGAPTIRGTAQVGETLTADTSGIGDTDSITGISYSYQWVRNDGTNYTDITGATDPTYTMVAADEGRTIKVGVSFTDDAGNEETLTSAATSSVTARPEQGIAPNAPDLPIGTAVFVGGVDLEWNEVPVADSYEVQLYQNGQWIDLPGDGVEIAFYGAGAIISGLDPSLTLWFQVRARNAHGSSDWSDFSSLSSTNQFTLGKRARSANEAARGAPVINGTAQVGEILTADTTGIEDGNGLDRVQFRFQWATNDGSADTDIAGATNSTYTLAGSDEGKTIKVRVAFTDRGGYAESLTSDATETVSFAGQQQIANNPATGGPIIGGTVRVGETLATDVLGIADEDGLENATFSYQWISNDGTTDADIQGETGATYTLTDANKGKTVKVRVSFTDDADNEETVTSAATATVAARPNRPATGAPIIGGTVRVGETLATDVLGIADEDGLENATFSYQWISNDGTTDADIQGETGATYTLTDANKGKTVKVRVSFTDDADNEETVTSAATATVAARPNRPATGAPIIGGTVRVGETLATDVLGIADEDGLENATFSYQWISNDGTTDADIQGETGATYTLASAYVGKTIKVKVTFTDDADNEETLTSPATAEVAAGVPTDLPAKPRNLTGTANADGTVTLRWDAPDDDSVTGYQILRRRPTEGERTLLVHVNDTGSTATEYTDNDVTPDVLHTYRVTTINAVGLSRRSEFVNVTPTQPAEPAQNAPATGTPTISGNAQVGETLTADTSGIADADGLIGATYSYQWIRSDGSTDTDIQHATGSTYTLVEADEGQTIKVEVSFTDDAGNDETLSSGVTDAVAAPEPPAKPTGLSAAAVSHDAVTLAWDDPQDDAITGYIILRRDREIHPVGTFITITGDTGSADTTYTDDTVEPDKQYNYKVKAINEHGEVSERSDWVRANTPAVPVPDKPTGLSAAVSHDTVTLTWDDPQDDSITGYVILRRDKEIHPQGTFDIIRGSTGSADTTYTDDTVEPDKQYVYRIKAINGHGEVSEISSWVRAYIPAAPDPAGSPPK